jgi:hypothetical protein
VALLVAAACRVARISGYQGLNGDEAYTAALAQRPFFHMLHLFTFEGNGVLYPIVMWPLLRVDDSVTMLRAPALVAGVASVAALYWTGTRLLGQAAGLLAATLLAVSPLAISYSQLARPYVFALLFGILSVGCLDRALHENSRGWWAAYVGTTTALGYSNALALTLLAAHAALALAHPRRRQWLHALAALAAALVPLAVLLVWERTRRDPLYWLDPPGWQNLNNIAHLFLVNRYGLVAAVALTLLTLPHLVRRHRAQATLLAVIAWATVPVALLFAASQLSPVFWIGYLLPALPGVLLLIAAAATSVPKPVAALGLTVLAALSLRASIVHPDTFHPTGWQAAARTLSSVRNPGDPVIFDIPDGLVPAGYYDPAFASPNHHLVVNEWADEPLPQDVVLLDDPGGYSRAPSGPPTPALLTRLSHKTGSLHVILYLINRQPDIRNTPGLQWARRSCTTYERNFGDDLQLVTIRNCHTP